MFYDKSFITNLLKCQQCERSYNDYDQPRMLPCGKTICNQCITIIERQICQNSFRCILCDEKHLLAEKQRFPVNELAVNLIAAQPKEVYRGKETENLKKNLLNLDQLTKELTFDMDHGEDKIKHHCNELKRLVQLATEQKVNEINQLNQMYIKQIDDYELDCIGKYSTRSGSKLEQMKEIIAETNLFLIEKQNYLEQFQISDCEILSSNERSCKLKSNLEEQILNIKSVLFDNNLMEFEINKSKVNEKLIGSFRFNKLYSTKTKIVSGSDDNTIKIWDLNSGECLTTLHGHSGEVNCVEIISNEKLVSGSSDKTLKVWDVNTGECLLTLHGHTDWVNCLQKLTDNIIVSGSGDQTIKIWDLSTGVCSNTLQGYNGSAMCIQKLSEDKIISGSDDWTIKIWDLTANECFKVLEGHFDQVWMLKVYSEEKLISCSADKTIKIWNIETGDCLKTLKSHTDLVYWIDVLSNDKIVSCSHDKTIKVWDFNTGNCLKTLRGHSEPVDCIEKISNDKIVSCSVDKSVRIWNVNTGDCLRIFIGHSDEVNCVVSF